MPLRRWRYVAGVVGVLLVGGVAFLMVRGNSGDSPRQPAAPSPTNPAVIVQAGSISSVLALTATAVARPGFEVLTPTSGHITGVFGSVGRTVAAGERVASVDGHVITAPADCLVLTVPTVGDPVAAGASVVGCRYDGYGLVASIPAEDAYRLLTSPLSAKAEITNGPGPFDCAPLVAPAGPGITPGQQVVCAVPTRIRMFPGAGGVIGLKSTARSGVLVLPTSAVAGSAGSGTVYVLRDGRYRQAAVQLGVTDGASVEIVSGLRAGDRVSPDPPGLVP